VINRLRSIYLFACLWVIASAHAQTNTNDSIWFEDYFTRATDQRELSNYSAFDSLEIVKAYAEKINYQPAVCRYYIEKASWYTRSHEEDSVIVSFKTAIRIAEKNKLNNVGANAYVGLANFYEFNGNTLEAARNYLNATRLLKSQGRKRALIGLYRNLDRIHIRLQQKNDALQNMLSAVINDNSKESDLINIINTKNTEESGLHFTDGSMVKEVGTHTIYVILGDAKFKVKDFKTQSAYGAVRDIQRIPAGTLASIPDMPRTGSLVRENTIDPKVYLVKNNKLYQIQSPEVLDNYGSWDAVFFVPDSSLKDFPKSDTLVTQQNMNTIFNLNQEFDNLSDSIASQLERNTRLSNELSEKVAERNQTLQQRKTLLWVSAIGVASLLLIVFLLARNFRQKQKLNKQSMLTAIEKERTRIATDMHDDLGAGLSRIKFLSETIGIKKQQQHLVEEDLKKINEYSHEMIDKMGEIVWALNEKNDSLSDLLAYTRSYAVDYLSQNGVRCTIQMPETISEHFLSGEFRRNIYLSVKEALHNIVKHAYAKEVQLKIENGNNLVITIHDDGVGISENPRPFSNGLSNMKKRMMNIGGDFNIARINGTQVQLIAPISVS